MLQYYSSEKKLVKLLKIALSRSYLGKNWAMNDFLWRTVLCDILLPFLAKREVIYECPRREDKIPL